MDPRGQGRGWTISPVLLARAEEVIEQSRKLLQSICRLLALSGQTDRLSVCPLLGGKADIEACLSDLGFWGRADIERISLSMFARVGER